jgi:adenosylcobalamin-dependent ribonucleoside-triphosphate reductase
MDRFMPTVPTARAQAVTLRTYCRPTVPGDNAAPLETWEAVNRRAAFAHHERLWKDAGGNPDYAELEELYRLGVDRRSTVAGRTLWLGGTEYAYSRAVSQFNCAGTPVQTVYDVVDASWALLNGSGVGFAPKQGVLHGYVRPINEFAVVPSDRDRDWKGDPENREDLPTQANDWTWRIVVGDSAEAWAKAIGKLFNLSSSRNARRLVVDGSNVRGPGGRLKGYGWICNGFQPLADCLESIHEVLNRKAGNLLDEIDVMDCINHVGQVLSSRRAAQATQLDAGSPIEREFAGAKLDYWKCLKCGSGDTKAGWCKKCKTRSTNTHRRQSNNSELFWSKPTKQRLLDLLYWADACGGDPGIVNAEAARVKCPWFEFFNPCFEIMLGAFCNLVNNCLPRFRRDFAALERAVHVIARANYRQTCVNLLDGVLQPRWHQTNDALRLCGVSLTGIRQASWLTDHQVRRLRNAAVHGAYSMADDLGQPRPKAVTTVTPGGTISKVMGGTDVGEVCEGVHGPLGAYIFNWVNYSVHDPIVDALGRAGYRTMANPQDANNTLVCFPVEYPNVPGMTEVDGTPVNLEPAVAQLDRYLRWNNLWADHNVSCTVSYSPDEIPAIADWLDANWDRGYVATAFLRRTDPTMKPEDVGQPYLPQEVVTGGKFADYTKSLRPVDWSGVVGTFDPDDAGCATGACPSR